MAETEVRVSSVVAVSLWLLGLVLVVVDLVTGVQTGELGLLFAGGGGCLTMRRFMAVNKAEMLNAMELGRDIERHRSEVRALR